MNSILLISEDYLKTNSNLNDNAFGKWILPAIRESQEMGLMPIIGECLYNKVCELVENGLIENDLYAAYKDLLDDRIQPYLLYQTLTNIVPILNGKMANIGTVATNDEHIITLSQGELDLTQNYYRERADFYAKRLQEWVKNNSQAFPELDCTCSTKPNLERSNNSVGMWLGGPRGKRVAKKDCGCGTKAVSDGRYQDGYADGYTSGMQSGYTSGYTDGFEDGYESGSTGDYEHGFEDGYESGFTIGEYVQKAKLSAATFTQNKTYTREDGWSAITVNVPQTGGSCNLQGKSVSQNSELALYTPDSGYNGISAITVNASGYGQTRYESGYQSGYTDGTASCTGGSCNLQSKNVSVSATSQTFNPDNGYDGMSAITVSSSALCNSNYNSGYTEGYSGGYDDGYTNGYSDGQNYYGTQIIPQSSVTLTDYGVYYFYYDSATSVSSMTVNFENQSPTPTTGTVGGFIRVYCDGSELTDFVLYNTDADASTLESIQINGNDYTGTTYTGRIDEIIYTFNGPIPNAFFSGWTGPSNDRLYVNRKMEMHFNAMVIGNNAFKDLTNIYRVSIMTNYDCQINTGAFSNCSMSSINLYFIYKNAGYTFQTNSVINNSNLNRINIEAPNLSGSNYHLTSDGTLFYGSKPNGSLRNSTPFDVLNSSWWQNNLSANGWTYSAS